MLNHARRCIALVCFMIPPLQTQGAEWIGNPTIGDFIREDIKNVVNAAAGYIKAREEFNQSIASARKRYFDSLDDGDKAAEADFAKLLYAKDIAYMTMGLGAGTEDGSKRFAALNGLTGGTLDRGIDASAWPAFTRWVDAVRMQLGATHEKEMLFVTDPDRLYAALEASQSMYERYRLQRDTAELVNAGRLEAKEQQAILADDGSPKLINAADSDLTSYLYHSYGYRGPRLQRLAAEKANGPKLLNCEYAAQGRNILFSFWKDRVPTDIDSLMREDQRASAVSDLGVEAYTECPPSQKIADSYLQKTIDYRNQLNQEMAALQRQAQEAKQEAFLQQRSERKARDTANAQQNQINAAEHQRKVREKIAKMKAYSRGQQEERQALQMKLKAAGYDNQRIRKEIDVLRHQQQIDLKNYRTAVDQEYAQQ